MVDEFAPLPKVNCWEDRRCGLEPGGLRAATGGVCPAAADASCNGLNGGVNGGRICWEVEGTPCAPGSPEEKRAFCEACSFFVRVKYEEGGHFQPVKPGLGIQDPGTLHRLLNDTVMLTGICRDILGHLALGPLLSRVAGYARRVARAASAGVYLWNEAEPAWQLEARAGSVELPVAVDPEGANPVARAARRRNLVRETRPGPVFVLALPLSGEERPEGVVKLVKTDQPFTSSDEWFLREIALMASLGLQNARIVQDLKELRDLDKAKSRFVALVMHQVGSPLATVACSLQAIHRLGERLAPGEQRHLLQICLERIEGIQALKRRLLDLAGIRSGHHLAASRPVSPAEGLRREVETASLRAGQQGIRLRSRIPETPVRVLADPDGLRLIFANVIDNAVKYSTGHGSEVEVSLALEPGWVKVAVRDQGIGIPPEEQERLFEEFRRAPNAAASGIQGSGLGLTFVHELVTRYGGRIEVESALGRGSTFTVFLPVLDEEQ